MGIRPADWPPGAPREAEEVHRVEREAEAQGFGHRDAPGRRGRRRASGTPVPPADAVDVSGEYVADHEHEESQPAEPEEAETPARRPLDIEA